MDLTDFRALRRLAFAISAIAIAAAVVATAVTLAQSQSPPSISIRYSPHVSVPLNTAITGTVTLTGLDPNEYSSVIFRADATHHNPLSYPEASDCLGTDIDSVLTVEVDSASEVFTISVLAACSLHLYAHFELDLTLSKADANVPGGKVELATAYSRFSMTRYLEAGVPTATPPNPDVVAWMDPDPTTLDMTVNGEWHQFRFRADISKYLNDHLGVVGYGDSDGLLYAPGANVPSRTVADACANEDVRQVSWRRAINQPLTIGVCKAGQASILLWHETDGVPPLVEYTFTLSTNGTQNAAPSFIEGASTTRSMVEGTLPGAAIGVEVEATDSEGDTLTYSLGGADAPAFAIDTGSGQLRTRAELVYTTKSRYTVTVSVHDGKDSGGNTNTAVDDSIQVDVRVTQRQAPPPPPPPPTPTTGTSSGGGFGPAPVAPSFRDGFRVVREVVENTPEGEAVGEPIVATHPDDLAIEYSLSGADAAFFAIDAETAQIRVGEGMVLDFEGGRNSYTVNVTATDTSGTGALTIVNIIVVDIDHGPYDLDSNEQIDRNEVLASISDYFKSLIGKDEVIRLIRLYFAG